MPATLTQRMTALEKAHEVRSALSEVRMELAAGVLTLERALEDSRAQRLTLEKLLTTQPHWGLYRAGRLLKRLELAPNRRVGELTDRQRHQLAWEAQR